MEDIWAWPITESQELIGASASSQFLTQIQAIEPGPEVSQAALRKATAKDLNVLKPELESLFHTNTIPQIRTLVLASHKLDASEKQLKDRFAKWKWSKNIKKEDWAVVLRKVGERSRIGKKSAVQVRQQPLSQAKIDRYFHDHPETIVGSQSYRERNVGIVTKMEIPATPSHIDVCTPLTVGTPSPLAALSPQTQTRYSLKPADVRSPQRFSEDDPIEVDAKEDLYYASPVRHDTPKFFQIETLDTPIRDSSPSPNVSPPPSPTLSFSTIVWAPSKFRGQSPAPMYEAVYLPQISFDPADMFQRLYGDSLVDLMGSSEEAPKWQLERNPIGFRYRQREEDALWGKLDMMTAEFGEHDPDTKNILLAIATLLMAQGRYTTAEDVIRRVLRTYSSADDQNVDKLHTLNRLAEIQVNQGFHQDAMKIFRRIIQPQERLLGSEHPDVLITKHNMAFSFYVSGNHKRAENLGKEIIVIKTRIFGADHPQTLASINLLALAYEDQGLWNKAEKLEVQLVASNRKARGDDHPNTLASMSNLAVTYQHQGRWKEAATLGKQVLEIKKRVLGEEHPNTLASMHAQAFIYFDQGHWDDAEELQAEALRLTRKVRGQEHPETLTSMSNMAVTYWRQGRLEEAETLGKQTLEIKKRVLSAEHMSTLDSMGGLASVYFDQGRLKEAATLQWKVLQVRESVLGEEHPDTLDAKHSLALTYSGQDRFEDALELNIEVLEARARLLGKEHPYTITGMNNLAYALKSVGRDRDATDMMEDCLNLKAKIIGAEHSETLNSMHKLAIWWKEQGRDDEAIERLERCVELYPKVLGAEHSETLNSMHKLAIWWKEQGRDDEAVGMMMRCVELSAKALGAEHKDTKTSISWLKVWEEEDRYAQGEHECSSEDEVDLGGSIKGEEDMQGESMEEEIELVEKTVWDEIAEGDIS